MTQKEKQILLTVLGAILPHSVWGLHRGENLPLYAIDNSGAYMVLGYNTWFDLDTIPFKPYLRPMSSMTKEEENEYVDFLAMWDAVNWLNVHHFDYYSLIEKGLALEAPEDMYKK